jgi:hypothetical protein
MSKTAESLRVKRAKKRKPTKEPWGVRPYTDDATEIMRIIKASNGRLDRGGVLRELISEALTARRLGQIGVDESLSAVKDAQRDVVSGEVAEMKNMLADLLALMRGHGTGLDKILGVNRETFGVLFHVLRTVFNVEDMCKEHLVRPSLEEDGKKEAEISSAFIEAEEGWIGEAHSVVESVRAQLSQPAY